MPVTIDSDGWIKEALDGGYQDLTFGPFSPGLPKWIVLHGTAWPNGRATDIAASWARGSQASSHVIIDKDGTIVQGISLKDTAWGNSGATGSPRASFLPRTNLNFVTFSMEHCKYDAATNSDILTLQQQVSS